MVTRKDDRRRRMGASSLLTPCAVEEDGAAWSAVRWKAAGITVTNSFLTRMTGALSQPSATLSRKQARGMRWKGARSLILDLLPRRAKPKGRAWPLGKGAIKPLTLSKASGSEKQGPYMLVSSLSTVNLEGRR